MRKISKMIADQVVDRVMKTFHGTHENVLTRPLSLVSVVHCYVGKHPPMLNTGKHDLLDTNAIFSISKGNHIGLKIEDAQMFKSSYVLDLELLLYSEYMLFNYVHDSAFM